MNTFSPTFAQFLLQRSAGKIEPTFVDEGAKFVWARHPDEHGRGVGYRAKTRFTFPQRLLSSPAFGHAGGERHRRNTEHSRPGLQSKKRLVFRFPDEWPETRHCAPNPDS